jgi:NAD(P)-dependent dehydrogenase (short-subunit alcohol dehydrogenase family)
MARLEGKRALVTGGAVGIGRAAVRRFTAEGARVAFCDIKQADGERTAAETGATFITCDVTDETAVAATVRQAVVALGGLDVLYNNAGGGNPRDGKVTELPLDEFWRTIKVDLFGTFLFCRFGLPVLAEGGGGSVINTTSIRALIGTAGADAYTSAKGGVLALTRALALQWARHNIRVNAIAPGMILTDRVVGMTPGDPRDNPIGRKHLVGLGQPEDIANMALYLASDESRLVTGAILPVESGASAI